MDVINPRSALLSNFEVLTVLNELDAEHTVQAYAARVKKEDGTLANEPGSNPLLEPPSENLRTVEFTTLNYLKNSVLPTTRQDPASIKRLLQKLAPYKLAKTEYLQIVNLMPKSAVELYVTIDQCDMRFTPEDMQAMVYIIQSCLSDSPIDEVVEMQAGGESAVDVKGPFEEPSLDHPVVYDEEGWVPDEHDFVDMPVASGGRDDLADEDGMEED